jgi:hypothetical protein
MLEVHPTGYRHLRQREGVLDVLISGFVLRPIGDPVSFILC